MSQVKSVTTIAKNVRNVQRGPTPITQPLPDQDEINRKLSAVQSVYGVTILLALRDKGNVYAGTVSEKVRLARRAKNKVARKSRRINRKRSA